MLDAKHIFETFEIYSETILLTKKLKAFVKLENLLEDQKNDFQIDFFAFNEEVNQKIEIFVLEMKKKTQKSPIHSPALKSGKKKSSAATSNKQSKDYTVATSNKVSKDYTPISMNIVNINIEKQADNSDFSFTNTGKNSKSSLTFEEKSKPQSGYFQAFSDKKNTLKHPMGFIKYDNFFGAHPKNDETPKNPFFLLDTNKKQESSNDFVLPRKSFGEE